MYYNFRRLCEISKTVRFTVGMCFSYMTSPQESYSEGNHEEKIDAEIADQVTLHGHVNCSGLGRFYECYAE
jgi:hypothetical protein